VAIVLEGASILALGGTSNSCLLSSTHAKSRYHAENQIGQ
jgi:hypothetical protein